MVAAMADVVELEQLSDIDLLALMIAAEADNQPLAGQVAVACVPLERLRRGRWGASLRAVLLQPYQFSTFNDVGRPGALDDHWTRFRHRQQMYWMLARLAIDRHVHSPAASATHYCRRDLEPKPRWTLPRYSTRLGQIGDHIFYREH